MMAETTITITSMPPIDFAPASLAAELNQNLYTILSTAQGTVVLDRQFGLDITALDEAPAVAEAMITSQIYELVERYEPRAIIQQVSFEADHDLGRLIPSIRYEYQEVINDDTG